MKRFSLLVAVVLIAAMVAPVMGQGATSQTWTSSITYYTPSTTAGTLQITYYASDGTGYQAPSLTLSAHKAGSLLIGNVTTVPNGFAGSAVLSSDVPIMATYVQFADGTAGPQYGRVLYGSFKPEDAASTFYVPTVLYDPPTRGSTSLVGIQNIESFEATINLKFYAVGATVPTVNKDVDIKAQSAYIFRPVDVGLATGFSGSLVITGVKKGDPATPAKVLASSIETDNVGRGAYAFEGTAQGANKIYMPSMMCQGGADKQMSYYAIQNAGTTTATVTIKYYNTSGNQVGTLPATAIGAGGKLSTNPCVAGVAANVSGSAVIESTGAQIIAIAKIKSDTGMATAFVGQGAGALKVGAPYVRWAQTSSGDFRSYIAIMNVGDQPATNIVAKYYDGNGALAGQETVAAAGTPLNQFIKRNSTASSAGALTTGYQDFGFHPAGGAVEIESDQPIVVVLRTQRDVSPALGTVTRFAEDYNAVPIVP